MQLYVPASAASNDDYNQFLAEVDLAQSKTINEATPEVIVGDFNAVIGKVHATAIDLGHETIYNPHLLGRPRTLWEDDLIACSGANDNKI